MKYYHKIDTVFEREETGKHKLIEGKHINEFVKYLKDNKWLYTEKVDGCNTIVEWDGHRISFGGRTEFAEIPTPLLKKLQSIFLKDEIEQIFEQKFGEKVVTIYGEGYGPKINKYGELYCDNIDFIVFDINVGGIFLERKNVLDIAKYFGLEVVPLVLVGSIKDGVNYIKTKPKSIVAKYEKEMEGIVGFPEKRIYDVNGHRVSVKIKIKDFFSKQERKN